MILFLHAAAVSLTATEAGIARLRGTPRARHALVPGLVDPSATSFAQDEDAYRALRSALTAQLHGDETRVILSCSVYNAFAPRLEAELRIPVERSDDAGVWAALACGPRVGLAISYPPSYPIVERHLHAIAAELGCPASVVPLLDENAFAYAGDAERYGAILARGAALARNVDSVFLAQFSMDPFAPEVARRTELPVISALEACLMRLRSEVRAS